MIHVRSYMTCIMIPITGHSYNSVHYITSLFYFEPITGNSWCNNNPLLSFTHSNYFMSSLPVTDTLSLCKLIVTLKDNQVWWCVYTHLFIIYFLFYRFTYLNIKCNYVHDKLQLLRFYHSYMACNKQYVMDFRPYKILVSTMVLYIKYIT